MTCVRNYDLYGAELTFEKKYKKKTVIIRHLAFTSPLKRLYNTKTYEVSAGAH